MTSVISEVMNFFGIYEAPVTVSDFMWDILVLVVGLYIVKYCMIFITSLFSDMIKIH